MSRIALFGGSFNPIHNGHLHLAQTVHQQCGLDRMLLMPSGTAPHKSSDAYAPAADRLAMCRLAAEPYPWLEVSDYELTKPGKSYTVETLRYLHSRFPEDALFLLTGSDMLLSFDSWYCWQEILTLAGLLCVSRGTEPEDVLRQKAAELSSYGQVTVVHAKPLPMSSSQIRHKIELCRKFSCYLPENVVQYIMLHGLYGVCNGESIV
ncbi:nicotinate (nicotinamide) nucleotide adenylyltransferase [Ruminococcus champanellensis]|uniref:Probable nicotinate-nucleotide adenylyltransferase n=1 Tax=Ruminococcus champanellensis (strain DSM 18848 / JCM 17042 / KCTC 15320 / 18P13) TaxID=213810 RepID=D4LCT2_RUMC1|nr:nicotinate (nicotinamide) nucleotide adenylyltransferase [Ruminococcus champanellensis]CBL17427.1 nicotinate (nicotinamide) nucleotide adenylyltransferase [Ruminococcus champanellensis 18P13 = JCM 17042]